MQKPGLQLSHGVFIQTNVFGEGEGSAVGQKLHFHAKDPHENPCFREIIPQIKLLASLALFRIGSGRIQTLDFQQKALSSISFPKEGKRLGAGSLTPAMRANSKIIQKDNIALGICQRDHKPQRCFSGCSPRIRSSAIPSFCFSSSREKGFLSLLGNDSLYKDCIKGRVCLFTGITCIETSVHRSGRRQRPFPLAQQDTTSGSLMCYAYSILSGCMTGWISLTFQMRFTWENDFFCSINQYGSVYPRVDLLSRHLTMR